MHETRPLHTRPQGETVDGRAALMPRRRDVLIGTERLLIACADILEDQDHDVAAIVCRSGPVADWARERGLPLLADIADLRGFAAGSFDHLFSIANLSVIPADILALPARAAINFHDGPLPDYAGLNTPAWALMAGETRHAVTWHLMTERVDEGDVLFTQRFELAADETALSLNAKCFAAACDAFRHVVRALEKPGFGATRQPDGPARYFGRDQRPDAMSTIDWSAPAEVIARLVRALDFGGYRNPLGLAKSRLGGRLIAIGSVVPKATGSGMPPGTILSVHDDEVEVATGSDDLRVGRLSAITGDGPLRPVAGDRFDALAPVDRQRLSTLGTAAARHEPWWHDRFLTQDPLVLPQAKPRTAQALVRRAVDLALPGGRTVAALIAFLARTADKDRFTIGYGDDRFGAARDWMARELPLIVEPDWNGGFDLFADALDREIAEMHRRVGVTADFVARMPDLVAGSRSVAISIGADLADVNDADLLVAIDPAIGASRWWYRPDVLDADMVEDLQRGFLALHAAAEREPMRALGELAVLSPAERDAVEAVASGPVRAVSSAAGLHVLFAEQAARTPDRTAVTCGDASLSYAELDGRSNRFACYLRGLGVGPDKLVGLYLDRSVDLAVAVLGTWKAGGAYLPLDPAYPAERRAYMVEDARPTVIVTTAMLAASAPASDAAVVRIDADWPAIACEPDGVVEGDGGPDNLAYVIYTSGSTGRPKGVLVEHGNLLNFAHGMDERLEAEGTWLAVTGLGFDISVLELCWTLARGYHVVIAIEDALLGGGGRAAPVRSIGFSLFYFASATDDIAADQYRLLLEGARFADTHDFEAVWTPERHFHAFGGLYPNPSVTSAAIAAVTKRVKIRAGSVVAPLHHPARIAEEWALVDNLSNGRVGIAFASGWQPNDFALRPENHAERAVVLSRTLDDVRGLWRGETRRYPGPAGAPVEVTTYPRPVQPELPIWITSAGNPETFAAAGREGANVLTHLLGQTVEEVGRKLEAYRAARREAGHQGDGHVTMMVHTLVGEDREAIRSIVRKPLIEYLRTSANLVKQHAWSFPAFKRRPGMEGEAIDLGTLGEEEMDALLEHAFERYFETSGLFGTPEDCLPLVERLRAIGVDEIGCLIDFGVPVQQVLDRLPALDALRRRAADVPGRVEDGDDIAALIRRHGVTHLQCTPSLARMLAADPGAHAALGGLRRMMVGGEAFPPALARELRAAVGGVVMNMYGPTETTIWSAVHELEDDDGAVPLGRPLVNQQLRIVDRRGRPVRPGTPGELAIGGDGVTRGYLGRPELTAERFRPDPSRAGGRLYLSGDLVRRDAAGRLEFLGRNDHQVKIRGHRIELGEIEAALTAIDDVAEAIVIARADEGGDARLIAYITSAAAESPFVAVLRGRLRDHLPEAMIPSAFVALPALPRTPNGKIDRAALPAPDHVPAMETRTVPPAPLADGLQQRIAAVWCEILKLPRVGARDNFFDLGGHSLLAVQAHRQLAAVLPRPIALTDIFRFPTIEALSAWAAQEDEPGAVALQGVDRARTRRAVIGRRQAMRSIMRI